MMVFGSGVVAMLVLTTPLESSTNGIAAEVLSMPAIIYMLTNTTRPAGGVAVLLEHVETLSRHGFHSFAVCAPGFKPWADTKANMMRADLRWPCPPGSIIVIPEVEDGKFLQIIKHRADLLRVVCCQSFTHIPDGPLRDVQAHGIVGAYANSPLVSQMVAEATGWSDVPVVSCALDPNSFKPTQKRLAVAYMPSKLPDAQPRIAQLIGRSAQEIEWRPIQNVRREEAGRILAESAVFLALGFREGFGLPPLEAMAAGCVVVGFHATGGKAYATPENGFWHDEGDYAGCAESLRKALGSMLRMVLRAEREGETVSEEAAERLMDLCRSI